MSTQGSVFLPSNGANQFQDMVSHSSAPNWSKVSNENGALATDATAKRLMSEINHILSDVKRDATMDIQAGGKKKKASKTSKVVAAVKAVAAVKSVKAVKGKSKSKSAKKMKRASKDAKPKAKPKTKSAKSKSKSKKSSKQKGGETKEKKALNPAMQNMRKVANLIKTEIPDLKDGAPMTSTASKLIKKHGGVDEALAEVKKNKSAVKKLYNEVVKQQKENREKKKADKAKAKYVSSD